MARRKILDIVDTSTDTNIYSANINFEKAVKSAIVRYAASTRRAGSNYYKPSSLKCLRNMYFTRIKANEDTEQPSYNLISMANTGTSRHESIQDVLIAMEDLGYNWRYIDVEEYIKYKQSTGKCVDIIVKDKQGAETHLIDDVLHLSFRCDGILQYIPTEEYYLFEFKNQTSFKYKDKFSVDAAHIDQVVCYCMELDLDKALVLYENRDVCDITCPEVFEVSQELKDTCRDKLLLCESCVENMTIPDKCGDTSICKWCIYKTECNKY